MRFLIVAFLMALLTAACSSAAPSAAPSVTIDSTSVRASTVDLVFSISDDTGTPSFKVEWGDGTAEAPVEGQGQFVLRHQYAAEISNAIISIRASDEDGAVGSATAQVTLVPGATTTTAAIDTTTTTLVDTTTTTFPDTTTTSEATTTTSTSTTSTSTTSTSTTTTTTPEPDIAEFTLDVTTGVIQDRWGSGAKQTTWNGRTATAKVKRHDNAWEDDGIRIVFPIPKGEYLDVAEDAVRLVFEFTAYIDSTYTLDTDKSDGNEAKIFYEFTGNKFIGWAGDSYRKSIKEDDSAGLTASAQEMSGVWALTSGQFNASQNIAFTLECGAKGPGGILVGSDSECDASLYVVGIDVRVTGER